MFVVALDMQRLMLVAVPAALCRCSILYIHSYVPKLLLVLSAASPGVLLPQDAHELLGEQ